MEESYLTFMRICVLGGDTFGAFRGGDIIQEGTLFNFTYTMLNLRSLSVFKIEQSLWYPTILRRIEYKCARLRFR